MYKKSLAFVLTLLLTVSLFAGCGSKTASTGSDGGDTIKIGAVLPLTGDIATFGESSKKALELLVEETNKKGGILGKKVQVVYEDDENKPANSANAIQKLINNDKVVSVIGSIASKCSLAAGPVATQNKIPMITPDSTNPKVTTEGGDYVFRACFIDPFQGTVVAKFAVDELKAKTAAVMYDVGNDYSKGLAEFFKAAFEAAGGKVVAYETYSSGDQDFNAQLTKIKPLNPDVLLVPDYYQVDGLVAKQAKALDIKATFLGGDGWDSADLFKVGGDAVNGAYFSNHYSPEDTTDEVVTFRKSFEAKYNSTPDALAALAYDAGKILFAAIEKAGSTDGAKIKDALNQTDIKVVSGQIKYDKDRNPIKSAVIIKVENGKQVFVKKVNP
jgi:branched-chain amino acid transport system substrate-binding protein